MRGNSMAFLYRQIFRIQVSNHVDDWLIYFRNEGKSYVYGITRGSYDCGRLCLRKFKRVLRKWNHILLWGLMLRLYHMIQLPLLLSVVQTVCNTPLIPCYHLNTVYGVWLIRHFNCKFEIHQPAKSAARSQISTQSCLSLSIHQTRNLYRKRNS